MGAIVYRVDDPELVVETARAAATVAFETGRSVAVLLGQRLIGAKVFRK